MRDEAYLIPSGTLIHPAGHNRHGPKIAEGGAVPLLAGGELGPHVTQCRLSRGLYLHTKWYPDASSCLATTDMGQKLGGGPGSPSNKVAWAKAYLHTKWHLSSSSCFTTMDMGRKLGERLCPHVTQCRLRPGLPSGILIHPTVLPQ